MCVDFNKILDFFSGKMLYNRPTKGICFNMIKVRPLLVTKLQRSRAFILKISL